jgi:hypothetical protein
MENIKARKDLTGQVFSRLTVMYLHDVIKNRCIWHCVCDCGKETNVRGNKLTGNYIKSCGCLNNELRSERKKTHGLSDKIPEYRSWLGLRERCYCVTDAKYNHYGGRGIKVCDRWRYSFENFLADMGRKPTKNHSIDRIDNDGDYCPENCRWATKTEQVRNRRVTLRVNYTGFVYPLIEICKILDFNYDTICTRVYAKKITHQQSFDYTYSKSAAYHIL